MKKNMITNLNINRRMEEHKPKTKHKLKFKLRKKLGLTFLVFLKFSCQPYTASSLKTKPRQGAKLFIHFPISLFLSGQKSLSPSRLILISFSL